MVNLKFEINQESIKGNNLKISKSIIQHGEIFNLTRHSDLGFVFLP